MRVTVIDYRAGNLTSVVKALHSLGADVVVTEEPDLVRSAERIVLPGVGHFAATRRLEETGIKAAVADAASRQIPFLGICVGLQWLFGGSTEAPECTGLGALSGSCQRFAAGKKVPHVGWNSLSIRPESRLLAGVDDGSFAYFTHSYRAPVGEATVAVTDYCEPFSAAVERGNVMGVQFHPEKSGEIGLTLLRNFLELPSC
ncbi:MAG TPA: imidazole glycerol phosphate synthase subunit HisH [Acidobacteriaceae bacterium]|jgi:glutamine amidotransferase|nr:imidazole glycerol phosphate synthase subunit HisH [Acidobacteriaceae bacterium]